MTDDETFAHRLSARADRVVPTFAIDPERVARRARTRRMATRSASVTAAAVAVVVAGAWAAPGVGWEVFPHRPQQWAPASNDPPPAPVPDATPSASAVPLYWYSKTETTTSDEGTVVRETWSSRELPGVWIIDGDLTQPGAGGPHNVLGRFRIDGVWVDMLRDPAALPTDAGSLAGVLHDSVEPDRRQGTDDQKVFGMVRDLLMEGGLLPADLRLALWDVAAQLPGAQVADGEDSAGRSGRALEYAADDGHTRWVGDPATGLLLERDEPWGRTVYVEQRADAGHPGPADDRDGRLRRVGELLTEVFQGRSCGTIGGCPVGGGW